MGHTPQFSTCPTTPPSTPATNPLPDPGSLIPLLPPVSPPASTHPPSVIPATPQLCPLPAKPELTRQLISMHGKLQTASGPNAFMLRLPVPSNLHIPNWRHRLQSYRDRDLCEFLEFGWPVGYSSASVPVSTLRNHGSATAQPSIIQSFLDK